MAEQFNFEDTYASDSCDEDTWEGIYWHVGLSYGESGDEQDTRGVGSKEGLETTDGTVAATDEAVELQKDLKQLWKITKLQWKQLEKWMNNANKSFVDEVKSTYKNYVQYCGYIDDKFKKLLGIKEVTKTEVLWPIYQPHKKTTGKCPKCDYEAMSGGMIYSHMAEKHNLELIGCDWCGFETVNPTSLHNHKWLYCKKKGTEIKIKARIWKPFIRSHINIDLLLKVLDTHPEIEPITGDKNTLVSIKINGIFVSKYGTQHGS